MASIMTAVSSALRNVKANGLLSVLCHPNPLCWEGEQVTQSLALQRFCLPYCKTADVADIMTTEIDSVHNALQANVV